VHREELVVASGADDIVVRGDELGTDDECFEAADQEQEERGLAI
jgi:hypothetical protein